MLNFDQSWIQRVPVNIYKCSIVVQTIIIFNMFWHLLYLFRHMVAFYCKIRLFKLPMTPETCLLQFLSSKYTIFWIYFSIPLSLKEPKCKTSLKIQSDNKNTQIDERQTTQWPKEKKPRNSGLQNITQKTEDWATRTSLKPGRTQVLRKGKKLLLHYWHRLQIRWKIMNDGKDRILLATSGAYPWSFVIKIFRIG